MNDHRRQDRDAREAIEAARRTKHPVVVQVEDLDRLPVTFHYPGYVVSSESDRPTSLDARTLMMADEDDAA